MPEHHSDEAAREVCQVLLTLLRCVSMKRALCVTAGDHLNFFRIYDTCLMDVAVISWWKIFGNWKDVSHWRSIFGEGCHGRIESELHKTVGGEQAFCCLWKEVKKYRNEYIAHHVFDEGTRPNSHIGLDSLYDTGRVIYNELFRSLRSVGMSGRLPDPDSISGDRLGRIEAHWREIANVARKATEQFTDLPPDP